MEHEKKPSHIDLAPGDVALVIRKDGELEMFLPTEGDEPFSPAHLMLVAFGLGYTDERLKDLLGQILQEKKDAIPPPP
jgi:hypothetical protein